MLAIACPCSICSIDISLTRGSQEQRRAARLSARREPEPIMHDANLEQVTRYLQMGMPKHRQVMQHQHIKYTSRKHAIVTTQQS